MKKVRNADRNQLTLGTISGSTLGGIRGALEPVGLFTAGIRLD